MRPQPSLLILSAVAAAGALLLGCEGGITQIEPGEGSATELVAAYVDPITAAPSGVRATDNGDHDRLPLVDGDAQDKEWNVAQPLFVYVSGDQAMGGPGFYVELRAVWSDEARLANPNNPDPLARNFLYLLVRYADETWDIFPDYWRYARSGSLGLIQSPIPQTGDDCDSVIVRGENWFVENPDAQEDQVSLMFEIEPASDGLGTYGELGCQIACHGGQFGQVPNGKLDVWTWRAGRTNAQESTVYPDFARFLESPDEPGSDTGKPESQYPLLDPRTSWPAYMEDMWADAAGLHHDQGDLNYPPFNRNGFNGQLYVRNESLSRSIDGIPIPTYITERVREERGGTGGTADEQEPANGELPKIFYLWGPTAQTFDRCDSVATSRLGGGADKWSERLLPGETDVMPGYLLFIPSGSAADVRAKGDHATNQNKRFPVWTLEVRRPMVTGPQFSVSRPDDVTIDPTKEYTFTIAIFNRSSQIHSGSGPLKLRFAPSLYAHKAGGAEAS